MRFLSSFFAALLAVVALSSVANASFILTFQEVGGNLEITASGSLNTTNLTLNSSGSAASSYRGSTNSNPTTFVRVGNNAGQYDRLNVQWIGSTTAFGSGSGIASAGTGLRSGFDINGDVNKSLNVIIVPTGYVSGSSLDGGKAVFNGKTLTDFGLSVGNSITYQYRDLAGNNGGSITLQAVPEPGSLAVVSALVAGLSVLSRRRRQG